VLEVATLCSRGRYALFSRSLRSVLEVATLCSRGRYALFSRSLRSVLEVATLCSRGRYALFSRSLRSVLEVATLDALSQLGAGALALAPDGDDAQPFTPEDLPRHVEDLRPRHCLELGEAVAGRGGRSGEFGEGQVVGDVPRVVEHGLVLPAAAPHRPSELFGGGAALGELVREAEHLLEDFGGVFVGRLGAQLDEPGVRVGFIAGAGVVAEPPAVAEAVIEPRRHAVVDDAQEHLDGGFQRV